MSGTYVARGDVGRGLKLAGRTRESVGKNTGLIRFKIDCLQRFRCKAFNFRTINGSGALRAYCYASYNNNIYYGERCQFCFETRPLR